MTSRALLAFVLLAGAGAARAQAPDTAALGQAREAMVDFIRFNGVRDSATLAALLAVPRHEFVAPSLRSLAYGDHPLPIGYGQSISEPYIVAYMTEMLRPRPGMRVLEIGTGSGYQAAVLAAIGCEVYSVEIVEPLARTAAERLQRLGYGRVRVRQGDGYFGWPEAAPFQAIVVTAASGHVPPPLLEQLAPGGRMIIPVGSVYGVQNLVLVDKQPDGKIKTKRLLPVRFVPLVRGPP